MERKFKITIPEPCHENWDAMTPKDNGRFCISCSKTVVDFTSMLPEEIQHYFIQNQNNKICGRFRKSQLDTLTIQIPSRVLYSQTQYHKMFLLALFIAMGTTLFSCQDKDGNKKKIDTIEVVDTDKNQDDKLKQIPPPPPSPPREKNANRENLEKLNRMVSGEIIPENQTKNNNKSKNKKTAFYSSNEKINCEKTTKQDSIEEDNTFFIGAAIETKADYPNGINAFYDFFAQEFKLPESVENLKHRIVVSFVIDKDGSLTSFEFPKNTDLQLKTEIIRVLKLSPKWVPGTQNGKKIRIKYSLPILIQS
ncbi:hypothetical protein [Flavobacterium sp. KACC 22761]|uniref:energy transducer TonB n=1 Tax=Flavobacterium sp. KACC 22761 TaxID=3092665 RepID=UPI002A752099|nr:hypothetical protein [Flavobacterium sp. KACC 22761]WPO80599.1 hypothetical protein SCB73_09460 [Flavobacterium sp. KACC 22761]